MTAPRNADARGGDPGVVCGSASGSARSAHGSGGSTRPATYGASPIDLLLSRLEGVRKSGKGWQARCPAHGDRHASLSIGEAPTGAALLHCHAGCSADAICSRIGLSVSDLFPAKIDMHFKAPTPEAMADRARWSISAVLPVLVEEGTLIQIAGATLCRGEALTAADVERVGVAVHRVDEALTVLKPRLLRGSP